MISSFNLWESLRVPFRAALRSRHEHGLVKLAVGNPSLHVCFLTETAFSLSLYESTTGQLSVAVNVQVKEAQLTQG